VFKPIVDDVFYKDIRGLRQPSFSDNMVFNVLEEVVIDNLNKDSMALSKDVVNNLKKRETKGRDLWQYYSALNHYAKVQYKRDLSVFHRLKSSSRIYLPSTVLRRRQQLPGINSQSPSTLTNWWTGMMHPILK
jgi:hypothetical protein